MNIFKLFLIFLINISVLNGMKRPAPETSDQPQKKIALSAPGTLVLVSAEGSPFRMPFSAVKHSGTLMALLEAGVQEASTGNIKFRELSYSQLDDLMHFFWAAGRLPAKKDTLLSDKATLDSIEENVDIEIGNVNFLKAAHFLDIPLAIDFVCRRIVSDAIQSKNFDSFLAALKLENARSYIASYYFLFTFQNIIGRWGIVASDYQLSIQNYLDYQSKFLLSRISPDKSTAYFNNLYIRSLQGIENIPNVMQITYLKVSNNYLTEEEIIHIRPLTQLTILSLDGNKIRKINKDTFLNFIALTALVLSNNELSDIEDGSFSSLIDLDMLGIASTQLKNLHSGLFTRLTNLNILEIQFIPSMTITPDCFNSLINLWTLEIDETQFEVIKAPLINSLTIAPRDIELNVYPIKNISEEEREALENKFDAEAESFPGNVSVAVQSRN